MIEGIFIYFMNVVFYCIVFWDRVGSILLRFNIIFYYSVFFVKDIVVFDDEVIKFVLLVAFIFRVLNFLS